MIPLFRVAMEPEAVSRAVETLLSGYVGQGPRVEAFEREFGRLVEAPQPPLATSSGTAALSLALRLLGVGPGDEVVSTPMTCVATNAPIALSGATIRWADVDPRTGLIDPEDVGRQLTARTKAIVAVDWGGLPCDYAALRAYGVPVIEDAAHALLARYGCESIARSGGDYVFWSFQAIKHLTTVDGGALLAPADQMERGRLLRWYGLDRRTASAFRAEQAVGEVGTKWHMNDVAAAVGLGNLQGAADRVRRCRENAAYYDRTLRAAAPGLQLPLASKDSAWWLYTLLVDDRPAFVREMADAGVECGAVHARNDLHPGFEAIAWQRDLPGVAAFAGRQVSIPVGWWLSEHERDEVLAATARAAQASAFSLPGVGVGQ